MTDDRTRDICRQPSQAEIAAAMVRARQLRSEATHAGLARVRTWTREGMRNAAARLRPKPVRRPVST